MTYRVEIWGEYPSKDVYIFTDRQEAKDFYRAEQRKSTYKGGTAYDENHLSIFADEYDKKMPKWAEESLGWLC